jgi:hypothetical protein
MSYRTISYGTIELYGLLAIPFGSHEICRRASIIGLTNRLRLAIIPLLPRRGSASLQSRETYASCTLLHLLSTLNMRSASSAYDLRPVNHLGLSHQIAYLFGSAVAAQPTEEQL